MSPRRERVTPRFARMLAASCANSHSVRRVWPGRGHIQGRAAPDLDGYELRPRQREQTSMATYHSNVSPHLRPADEVAAEITIRTIGLSDLRRALQLGWQDFQAMPSHAVMLCAIYPVLGLVLARAVMGYSVLPLLFPLAAGFT